MTNICDKNTRLVAVLFLLMAIILIPAYQRSLLIIFVVIAVILFVPAHARKITAYSQFTFPALFLLLLLIVFPFVLTVLLSVFRVDGTNLTSFSWNFIGIKNFANLFDTDLNIFSVWRTIQFSIIAVFFELFIGLFLGFCFSRLSPKMDIFRVFFVLPVVIPPLIAGMLWRSIFDQSFGLLNQVLSSMGYDKVVWLSLSSPKFLNLLSDSIRGLESIINFRPGLGCALVTEIWQWTPFVALIIAAALRTIPREQIEWAKSQGAYFGVLVRKIYIPYIIPILGIVGIIRIIDCLKTYESIWTLFANNPQTASLTIRITTYALEIRNFGMGAALSIFYIILASLIITIFAKKFFATSQLAHNK